MAETLWYYEDAGRQAGPVPEAALQELIRSGRVAPQARVWRAGMAGWQPWPTVPELAPERAAASAASPAPAAAGGPGAAPGGALTPAPAGGDDYVDLTLLVVLSIVTFGIYGLVKFYGVGLGYARRASPARASRFETLFWVYVACYIVSVLWFVFPAISFLGVLGAIVAGFLLLNEVLDARAEVLRAGAVQADVTSETTHKVLFVAGWLTSWFFLGVILLVVQGFKFFQDHNALVRALRVGGWSPEAPGPAAAPPRAAPASEPLSTVPATAAAGAGEALPAERACVRCAAPLSPADRFCSRCGAPA